MGDTTGKSKNLVKPLGKSEARSAPVADDIPQQFIG
jgi:hypothetical protein